MVVADSIQVVIARNVERDAILVVDGVTAGISCAEPATSATVEVQPNVHRVARVELEEGPEGPAAQSVTSEAFFALKEGQLVGRTELISVPVVFCTPSVGQTWQGIRDVVVRRSAGSDAGASREQFGVDVQQFRVGIARLKLQAVAHALLRLNDEGVVVGADAVRAVIETCVQGIGPDVRKRSVVC